MTALRSPLFQYTMQTRALIGLLFTRDSSPEAIGAAYRETVRQLRRLSLDVEMFDATHRRLRKALRRVRRENYVPQVKERAAVRVMRLTVAVLAARGKVESDFSARTANVDPWCRSVRV